MKTELTFKRYVISSVIGELPSGNSFFSKGSRNMNIFVYSDESGVFDVKHNKYYVYGGIIFLDKKTRDLCSRKYLSIERMMRKNSNYTSKIELKASVISNKEKNKLFKSLNDCYKFGAVIDQNRVLERIFAEKKSKQRFLDYVYKVSLKKALVSLINKNLISADLVENIYVYADEHTTATNGRYELHEALEQEFKYGTINYEHQISYPPVFKNLHSVQLKLCDSSTKTLIRAADIVANRIYYLITNQKNFNSISNININFFP